MDTYHHTKRFHRVDQPHSLSEGPMKKLLLLSLLCCQVAATEVYLPQKSDYLSQPTWGYQKPPSASNVWLNPANTHAPYMQLTIESIPGVFDYDTLRIANTWPISPKVTLGAGYSQVGADDIVESRYDTTLPYTTGRTLSDKFQQAAITSTYVLNPKTIIGATYNYWYRSLAGETASAWSLDGGINYQLTRHHTIGGYTQQLLSSHLTWSTGHKETLTRATHLQWGAHYKPLSLITDIQLNESDLQHIDLQAHYPTSDWFSLHGGIRNEDGNITQTSYGGTLDLEELLLSYTLTKFDKNGLEETLHQFQLTLNLNWIEPILKQEQ